MIPLLALGRRCFEQIRRVCEQGNFDSFQDFIQSVGAAKVDMLANRVADVGLRLLLEGGSESIKYKVFKMGDPRAKIACADQWLMVPGLSQSHQEIMSSIIAESTSLVHFLPYFPGSYGLVVSSLVYLVEYTQGNPELVYPIMYVQTQYLLNGFDVAIHLEQSHLFDEFGISPKAPSDLYESIGRRCELFQSREFSELANIPPEVHDAIQPSQNDLKP